MSTPQHPPGPRIVVGVDGSPSSLEALRWAVRQARLTGGSVDAVIAWVFPVGLADPGVASAIGTTDFAEDAERTLSGAVASAVPGSDVSIRQHVVEGHPAGVLVDAAAGADLLVVGCRGHGGFTGMLLGSVSQHCVHHASCPVLIMRGHPQR